MTGNLGLIKQWCLANNAYYEVETPAFSGSGVLIRISYRSGYKSIWDVERFNDQDLNNVIKMLSIWRQMMDLDHVVASIPPGSYVGISTGRFSSENYAPGRILYRSRVREGLPAVPKRQIMNCDFCEAEDLDNFYTGSSGRVACPSCFKQRVDKQLAKEKKEC